MSRWTQSQLTGLHSAAQSLKLYRRAELYTDEGESLIKALYVDPLPGDHVLATVLKKSSTFLIGRKGTGKSTIFQRAQAELIGSRDCTSAYIDIKTVFEASQVDPGTVNQLKALEGALSEDALLKLLLYREFITALVNEIKEQIKKRITSSFGARLRELFGGFDELFEGLDDLLRSAHGDRFLNVLALKTVMAKESTSHSEGKDFKASAEADAAKAKLGAKASGGASSKTTAKSNVEYSEILIRVFDVRQLIAELKAILDRAGIRHLFIFLDDFSELPEEPMQIVVDALLAPLNNWSEELIKFKVAAYPNRIYLGSIDRTKIDEVDLDPYKLYGSNDVNQMEDKAIDFTKRLVDTRIRHYCKCSADAFLSASESEVWRHLFYASMANPRNLGYILYFIYESNLLYDKTIGIRAIGDASQRYYDSKIEPYFTVSKFLQNTFNERSSIFSLKELLEAIVARARQLRSHKSSVMEKVKGIPPTSHFHVAADFESLLATLELNFFLTKYYEMKDRDGRRVVVFALNYGLCQKHQIEFGRPQGEREFRLYFVERVFDFTALLTQYMISNQEIKCDACAHIVPLEQLPALQLYGMKCPKCGVGSCVVTNLSKKYGAMLQAIDEQLLLPATELGILQTLHSESPMFPLDIAQELDCSYQLVGKRGRTLADRGLVERKENPQGRRELEITKLAEDAYFSTSQEYLDVPE